MLSNIVTTNTKLKTIWNYMNIETPSGFYTYRKTKNTSKLWKKY